MKDWGEPMGYEEVISKLEQRIEDSREELRNIGYHHTVDYECEDLQIAIDAVKRLMSVLPLISHLSQLDTAIAGQETLQKAFVESQRRERAAVEMLSDIESCLICMPGGDGCNAYGNQSCYRFRQGLREVK